MHSQEGKHPNTKLYFKSQYSVLHTSTKNHFSQLYLYGELFWTAHVDINACYIFLSMRLRFWLIKLLPARLFRQQQSTIHTISQVNLLLIQQINHLFPLFPRIHYFWHLRIIIAKYICQLCRCSGHVPYNYIYPHTCMPKKCKHNINIICFLNHQLENGGDFKKI